MSFAAYRLRTLGDPASPLLWSTHLPPMGLFPARERRSEIGRTSQTPQDSTNRISSERAAATSSGGGTAPVMSSRNCRAPLSAPR
eukprot:615456-Alexandrium_andersonii.AAC.1